MPNILISLENHDDVVETSLKCDGQLSNVEILSAICAIAKALLTDTTISKEQLLELIDMFLDCETTPEQDQQDHMWIPQ